MKNGNHTLVRGAVGLALTLALPMAAHAAGPAKASKADVAAAQEAEIQGVRDQIQALVERLNKLEAANAQLQQSNAQLAQQNAELKAQGEKVEKLEKAAATAEKARDDQSDSIAKVAAKVASVAAGNGIELYGVLDAGIASVQHSLTPSTTFSSTFQAFDAVPVSIANGAGGQTGVMNGGLQDSRWGIRGNKDIGNGLRVTFALESGINLPTGTLNSQAGALAAQTSDKTTSGSTTTTLSHAASVAANSAMNGQLFGRQAWVGVGKEGIGTLQIGRTYNPLNDVFAVYDPALKADGFSPFGISGTIGGGGGISEMTRLDNSVKYVGKFGNVNLSAAYALGGAGGIADANSGYALNAGYDNGQFGVQVIYDNFRNVIKEGNTTWSVTTPYYLKGTLTDVSDITIALKAKVTDEILLKGGFQHYALEKASRQLTSTSVVDGMLYGIPTVFASYADGEQKVDIYFFGGDYTVSHNFVLSAGYYDFSYDAWKTAGGLAIPSGGIKDAVLIADYTIGKNTDWYFGYMHSNFSGQKGSSAISTSSGAAAPNFSTNSIVGSGLRFKF
jgi:general bacterial porin, GBP family